VNIAVHFIRVRSNLILSCSSGGFSIYICYSVRRGRERGTGYRGKRKRGEESLDYDSSDYFFKVEQSINFPGVTGITGRMGFHILLML